MAYLHFYSYQIFPLQLIYKIYSLCNFFVITYRQILLLSYQPLPAPLLQDFNTMNNDCAKSAP